MKALALLALAVVSVQACIWDRDTVAMEKSEFPEVQLVITGNFARHSQAFYVWRKETTAAKLVKEPKNAGLYDDLAVSQHKLGDHRAAIATMQAKEKAIPGRYETYSNLGTFYIYTGELDEALKWINKALQINPNAHFGREKYQKWLVEWIQAGKPQGAAKEKAATEPALIGFAWFIATKTGFTGKPAEWGGRAEAVKGLTGMMRFADYDNPVLLEALGDVLRSPVKDRSADLLASQAYAQAKEKTAGDEKTRIIAKLLAVKFSHQPALSGELSLVDAETRARRKMEQIEAEEKRWIAAGQDASAKFEERYLKTPEF